jgi:NADH:ubiquinone oxidoreductase subunit C
MKFSMLAYLLAKNSQLKKMYIVFLKKKLNRYIKSIHLKQNTIYMKSIASQVYPVVLFFKKNSMCQFKVLSDIVCYDHPGKVYRFSLIYNLLSIDLNYRLKLHTKVKEKQPVISTVVSIFSAAG